MSRHEAKAYYQQLQVRLSSLKARLPQDLLPEEREGLLRNIEAAIALSQRQLEGLMIDDPRHPGA